MTRRPAIMEKVWSRPMIKYCGTCSTLWRTSGSVQAPRIRYSTSAITLQVTKLPQGHLFVLCLCVTHDVRGSLLARAAAAI